MQTTIEIVIAVVVLVAASMVLMFGYNTQIEGFSTDADTLEERGCEFQRERADDSSDLSPRCQDGSFSDNQNDDGT